MVLSLSSPNKRYDVNFLTNYAIINLQDELTRIPGVARIQVFGGQYRSFASGFVPTYWQNSASPRLT